MNRRISPQDKMSVLSNMRVFNSDKEAFSMWMEDMIKVFDTFLVGNHDRMALIYLKMDDNAKRAYDSLDLGNYHNLEDLYRDLKPLINNDDCARTARDELGREREHPTRQWMTW